MKNRRTVFPSILSLLLIISAVLSCYAAKAPKRDEKIDTVQVLSYTDTEFSAVRDEQGRGDDGSVAVGSRLLELIFGKKSTEGSVKDIKLCPGGDTFGVKICGSGVTVTKVVTELSAGILKPDDRIVSIDGQRVSTIDEVKKILNSSDGRALSFEILRGKRSFTENIAPKSCGGEYHLGVILSDGASGIGTVTYYDPESYAFGGLGHGICSHDGGEVLKMTRGTVTGVILGGASRGEASKPGELRGVLTDKNLGTLRANTKCGVFGTISPDAISDCNSRTPIPVAKKSEIREGEATIISTVKNGKRAEYKIEIRDIDYSSDGTKSFRIKVTDDTLIAMTGGIVRGMSGSPIIQDGKLVGAVTHVLVADPTEGYGIFIENMLNAANIPMAKAS